MSNQDSPFFSALRERASQLGFDDVGVCSVEPFEHWSQAAPESLKERLCADPRKIFPEARAIIVAMRRYDAFAPWPEGHGELTEYYVESSDSREGAERLALWVREQGWQAVGDMSPELPARAAALRTGLGGQGWNQQFCHDELGVLIRLDLVLTDAPLDVQDVPYRTCEGCGLCVEACPTGALQEGGTFTRDLCLRYHMIGANVVPFALRQAMGTRILGCSECTTACPHAQFRVMPIPQELMQSTGLQALLQMEPATLVNMKEAIGSNYARKHRLQAQAALCAGNSGDVSLVPDLIALLRDHPSAVVRSHSAWSLGRLGGEQALAALGVALTQEADEAVQNEIRMALGE